MDKLQEISTMMVERYSKRYNEMGYNVRTLGWGDTEQQEYRFVQTYATPLDGKHVLDIGCGFGDYYKTMLKNGIAPAQYTGWDINPDLVGEANTIFEEDPKANFAVSDLTTLSVSEPVADVGIMLGLLNLNLDGHEYNNMKYSKMMIRNAFAAVKETLVVDFISTAREGDWPKEDFIFYHNPAEMLEFALELSPNAMIRHDYLPIPQKEFMLFINKPA